MSKGFGRVEAGIIEQVMRSGIVAVSLLRFSPHRFIGSGRPFIYGFWGTAAPIISRQSLNRALLKLEAAKIVFRAVGPGGVFVRMTEAVLRQSYRVAGEVLVAHAAAIVRAASLDGIQLTSRDHDIEISAAGAFTEQKIVGLCGFEEPAAQIRISKNDQKVMKKLVDDAIGTIARVAEHLIISRKLSAARIKQLIENPLEGE